MKALNLLAAFIGGAAVGAAIGLLLAPEKGEDTRRKIGDALREKGIDLNPAQMSDLIDKITSKVKGESACE
ncbi:MAG: YtxH domain-containing protein [Phocaeicola sp.]